MAEKGSIAVDGVSLTVNAVTAGAFRVMLVPFTREKTHLDRGRPGDEVNLEADVLARYVARALGWAGESQSDAGAIGGGLSLELLAKQGFMR